jgi:hypothetical protein
MTDIRPIFAGMQGVALHSIHSSGPRLFEEDPKGSANLKYKDATYSASTAPRISFLSGNDH